MRMVDEIQLANMLENDFWKGTPTLFSIQDLIDEVVPEVLPVIKRKGLQLLINNHLPPTTNVTAIVRRCVEFC